MQQFTRTQNLIGEENLKKLQNKSVIIFGIGGVGSFAAEAIARCGVGKIALVDNDKVSISNINRQLIALFSTIGENKTDVMKKRIADINPNCKIETFNIFYQNEEDIDLSGYNYVIDAIDSVKSKINLICAAKKLNIPIISSMGTGNKLDPSKFSITDIYKTHTCPLAKVVRKELKQRHIDKLKVLFSTENPITSQKMSDSEENKRVPASISFVPSVAGLLIAGEVIKDLIN